MPRVKIDIRVGRSEEHKMNLLAAVHDALVESIKIPDDDRIQILHEHKKSNFEVPPNKTELFTIIEITLFSGRSVEAKRSLYRTITEKLEPLGIMKQDIMIILLEPTMENWGIRGLPASEINLGFKIDV
ncbi:tautomerase family protein [Paenibacillus sabinae]|uniref:4-oxalocrotonate tautomerase n=1 Tax=Paenibacillus sabinae T27 TaxID=1268072 RepID=X4ZZ82_9BACL|nr:tautomerase family protein [Paenibacillus sabinae]AHV96974.1 4-oxalocrotonate tautomerase [Paenibacillus sabinae T27]